MLPPLRGTRNNRWCQACFPFAEVQFTDGRSKAPQHAWHRHLTGGKTSQMWGKNPKTPSLILTKTTNNRWKCLKRTSTVSFLELPFFWELIDFLWLVWFKGGRLCTVGHVLWQSMDFMIIWGGVSVHVIYAWNIFTCIGLAFDGKWR